MEASIDESDDGGRCNVTDSGSDVAPMDQISDTGLYDTDSEGRAES